MSALTKQFQGTPSNIGHLVDTSGRHVVVEDATSREAEFGAPSFSAAYRPSSFHFPLRHTLADFLAVPPRGIEGIAAPDASPASPFTRVETVPTWERIRTYLVRLEDAEKARVQVRQGVHEARKEGLRSAHGVDLGAFQDEDNFVASSPTGLSTSVRGSQFLTKHYGETKASQLRQESPSKDRTVGGIPRADGVKAKDKSPMRSVRIKSTAEVVDYGNMQPHPTDRTQMLSPSRTLVPLVDATKGNAGPLKRTGQQGVPTPTPSVVSGAGVGDDSSVEGANNQIDGAAHGQQGGRGRARTREEAAAWALEEELRAERERKARALEASLVAFGLPPHMFGVARTQTSSEKATQQSSSNTSQVAGSRSANPAPGGAGWDPHSATAAAASPVVLLSPDVVQAYFAVKTLLHPLPPSDTGMLPYVCTSIDGSNGNNGATSKSVTTTNVPSSIIGGGAGLLQQKITTTQPSTISKSLTQPTPPPNGVVRIAINAVKFCNDKELEQRCQTFVTQLVGRLREMQRWGGGGGAQQQQQSSGQQPLSRFPQGAQPSSSSTVNEGDAASRVGGGSSPRVLGEDLCGASLGGLLYALHTSISSDPARHHHASFPAFQRYLRTFLFSSATATMQYRLARQLKTIPGAQSIKNPRLQQVTTNDGVIEEFGVAVTPFSHVVSAVLQEAYRTRTDFGSTKAAGGKAESAAELSTTTIAALGAIASASTIHIPSYVVENAVGASLKLSNNVQRDTVEYLASALAVAVQQLEESTLKDATLSSTSDRRNSPSLAPLQRDRRFRLLQAGMRIGLVSNQCMRRGAPASATQDGGARDGVVDVPRMVTRLELQSHAFYRDRHTLPNTAIPQDVIAALRGYSWAEYQEHQKDISGNLAGGENDLVTNASSGTLLPSASIGGFPAGAAVPGGGGTSAPGSGGLGRHAFLSFRGPLGRSTVAAKRASLTGQSPRAVASEPHNGTGSIVGWGPGQAAVAPVKVSRATKVVNTTRRTKVLFQAHSAGFGDSGRWGTLGYLIYGIRPTDFARTKEHLARLQQKVLRRQERRRNRNLVGGMDDGGDSASSSDDDDGGPHGYKRNRKASDVPSVPTRTLSRMMSTLSIQGASPRSGGAAGGLLRSNSSRRFSSTSSVFTAFEEEGDLADFGGDGGGGGGLGGVGDPPAAFVRRYIGPTPDGTAYLYYPQAKLPLLTGPNTQRGAGETLSLTLANDMSGANGSRGGATHPNHVYTTGVPSEETTLVLVSNHNNNMLGFNGTGGGGGSTSKVIHGTVVAESHWFSFLGIVFDGSSCRRRLFEDLGGGQPVAVNGSSSLSPSRASIAGRLLYYTMNFIPSFSGRDVTSYLLHQQRDIHNIFDFGQVGVGEHNASPMGVSSSCSLASVTYMRQQQKGGHNARTPEALLTILALFLHDFDVVGLLEGAGSIAASVFDV